MYHQDWCFLAVQGPESVHVMQRLFPEAGDLAFMQCVETEYQRRPVIVTRSGYTGEVGFELFTYQDVAHELWADLPEAMEPFGGVPCGLAARDVLRLEMGYPLYGQDLFESVDRARGRAWRGRSASTRGTSGAATSLAAATRRGVCRAVSVACGCTSAVTSRGRTTRCSSATSVVGEVTSGTFSPLLQHGDRPRLPVAGRRGRTWATPSRSTSAGDAARPRSSGRRSWSASPR